MPLAAESFHLSVRIQDVRCQRETRNLEREASETRGDERESKGELRRVVTRTRTRTYRVHSEPHLQSHLSFGLVTMSASSKVPVAAQTGAIAHCNFRVRCETLGHGEDVFLVQEKDTKRQKVRTGEFVI
jgi:hypothetical protein